MTGSKLQIAFRKPEPKDLDAFYEQKNDPRVKCLLGGFSRPQSRRDLDEWLEFHRSRPDEVLWTIVSIIDQRCLGHVGLYKIDPISRSSDFGIMIGDPAAWGCGVGTQATLHALRHAFNHENLNRVSLTVLATNDRAIRLYRKVGFIEEGCLREAQFRDGKYIDLIAMGLLKHEFVDGD